MKLKARSIFKRAANVFLLLGFVASLSLPAIIVTPASAAHGLNYNPDIKTDCSFKHVGASGTDPVGSGYLYRTVQVHVEHRDTILGQTVEGNCTLGRSGAIPILEWSGLEADQIWFGPEIPGGWTAVRALPSCAVKPPAAGINQCPNVGDPHFEVFQDDASEVYFTPGNRLHCYGMDAPGYPVPGCSGHHVNPDGTTYGDIYEYGTETSPHGMPLPVSGAGYFNVPARDLTSIAGTTGGKVNDIQYRARIRNTWSGGYGVNLTFTMRYPQRSTPEPSASDGCPVPHPFSNPERTYGLPPTVPPSDSVPGYGPAGARYYTYGGDGTYVVNNFADEWGQSGTWAPVGRSPNPFTVSYKNFIRDYPYDIHTPTISYTSYYWRDNYSATGPPVYTDPPPYCASYDIFGVCTVTVDPPPYIIGYSIVYNGRTNDLTAPGSLPTEVMQPCYNRNFYLEPTPRSNGVQWRDYDEEEPGWAAFGSHVDVRFALERGVKPLRRPMRLNYAATATYWIDRGGVIISYPQPRYGGPGCTNFFTGNTTIGDAWSPSTIGRDYLDCFRATIPPLRAGDKACFRLNFAYDRGQIDPFGNIVSSSGSAQTAEPQCSQPLVDRPYLRVYGGDVLAGSNFKVDGICNPTSGARIAGWNRGDRPPNPIYGNGTFGGAGTQLAAFALGAITDFVSAAGRDSSPTPLKGVSFANNVPSDSYGGNWDASNVACAEDYFALSSYARQTISSATLGNLNSLGSDSYRRGGDLSLNHPVNNISPGTKLDIFVDGDLAINGNINYVGAYPNIDSVPIVRLIVTGNIYIAQNVTNIDGILISQGTVYTCSNRNGGAGNAFAPATANDMVNGGCRSNLTINGGLIANSFRFLRTASSLRRSSNGETVTDPDIAERIQYSPEVWLAYPPTQPPGREPYEAFTSLPPIL